LRCPQDGGYLGVHRVPQSNELNPCPSCGRSEYTTRFHTALLPALPGGPDNRTTGDAPPRAQGSESSVSIAGRIGSWVLPVAVLPWLLASPVAAAASCIESQLASAHLSETRLVLRGNAESRVDLPAIRSQDAVVYAVESGVDVELEVHDAAGAI